MSWQASDWAKAQTAGSSSRKAVLLCLGDLADQWGWVWACEAGIAEDTEFSSGEVRKLILELADRGLITIFRARSAESVQTGLYRLNFAAQRKDPVPEDHPSLTGHCQHHRGPERQL